MKTAFFLLLACALFGNVRIGVFLLNRSVFGTLHEKNDLMKWLLMTIPPLMLMLTPLYWLAWQEAGARRLTGLGMAGWSWLVITASVGIYWIIDRALHNTNPERVPGTRSLPSTIVKLRKAHIPIALLRKLGAHNDLYDLEISRHELEIEDLAPELDGFRIAFLTDTHVASFMRRPFYRECVERVRAEQPDVVLLGGDFVSFHRDIPLMAELLLPGLEAREGVFAVLGNHDYWAGPEEIQSVMSEGGVQFLINRSVTIRRGRGSIAIVGIDEMYRGDPDVDSALEGIDDSCPRIVLSHHPDVIALLHGHRVDLMVGGHTHGGQIRLPWFGAIVVPSKHEGRYASGFHLERRIRMYVSRGLGAVPPIRILCPPEIAVFTLRRALDEGESPRAG
ncbi:MAG TPA: metallophosphoesterase [Thermoanaerobaculia bacterium]|nr:metallophosphoesterase [Thermoanaerobaculia bacterium]